MTITPDQGSEFICSQLNKVLQPLNIQASIDTEHIQELWRPAGTIQVTFITPNNLRESWKITHVNCAANQAPCLFYYGSEGDEFGIYLEKDGLMLAKNRDNFIEKGERLLMMSIMRTTKYECYSFIPLPGCNLATKIGMQTLPTGPSGVAGGFIATFDHETSNYCMWSFHTTVALSAPSEIIEALFTL